MLALLCLTVASAWGGGRKSSKSLPMPSIGQGGTLIR